MEESRHRARRGWIVLAVGAMLAPLLVATAVSANKRLPAEPTETTETETTATETTVTETTATETTVTETTDVDTGEPPVASVEVPSVSTEPVVETTEPGVESTDVVEGSLAPETTVLGEIEPPSEPSDSSTTTTSSPPPNAAARAAATPEAAPAVALAAAPATAPAWPGSVRARSGNEVVTVSWNAPARNGGSPIRRYLVQRSTNASQWTTVATTTSRVARISGLRNGTRYYFRVIAENAVGRSGPSWWAAATPTGAATGLPLHPHGLQVYGGDGVAVLSWKAPVRNIGGPVLTYRVQRSTNGSSWGTFAWVPASQRSLRITGLNNGTRYYFRVIAVNANGAGAPSWWARTTPTSNNPYTPIHPWGLRTSVGNGRITMRWNAPAYGPRPLTYRIQLSANPNAGWATVAWLPASTTATSLTGLHNGVRYYVRVIGVNQFGPGDPSWWAAATPVAVGGGGGTPIGSNFDVSRFLNSRGIPASTANEPSGNFRTVCEVSHFAYDDPIVYPGDPGMSHLHMFFGNTAADSDSTYASLRTTGDSTCEGGPINRSAYWVPAMFDGDGNVVAAETIVVYYKGGASGGSLARQQAAIRNVQPLPSGLRMVAGAPNGHITWECADGSNRGTTIPNSCPAGQELIGSISFPNCWDGRNLDSPNHRSHMAYKYYDINGIHRCPSSHPVELVEITERIFYPSAPDIASWSIASDMGAPGGSTLHADWFGAWDPTVMMRWHTHCVVEMRNGNNGDLCDGQGLSGARNYTGPVRRAGFTPMMTMQRV